MSVEVTDSVILPCSTGVDNIIYHCQREQRRQKQLVLINCPSCRLIARMRCVTPKKTRTHKRRVSWRRAVTQMDNMYFSANVSHSALKTHLVFIYESNNRTQCSEHLFPNLFPHRWITEQYKNRKREDNFNPSLPQTHKGPINRRARSLSVTRLLLKCQTHSFYTIGAGDDVIDICGAFSQKRTWLNIKCAHRSLCQLLLTSPNWKTRKESRKTPILQESLNIHFILNRMWNRSEISITWWKAVCYIYIFIYLSISISAGGKSRRCGFA